jgi:hypothetical protein
MINVLFLIVGLLMADGDKSTLKAKPGDVQKQSTAAATTIVRVPGSNPHNQPQPVQNGTATKQTEPVVSQLQWIPNETTTDTLQQTQTVTKSAVPVHGNLTFTP